MSGALERTKGAARLMGVLAVVAVLAGCAEQIEEEIGECEPGVEGISQIGDITPASCP